MNTTTTVAAAALSSHSTAAEPWPPIRVTSERLTEHRPLVAKFLAAAQAQIDFHDGVATISMGRGRATSASGTLRGRLLTALAETEQRSVVGGLRNTESRQPMTAGDHRG